MLLDTYVLTNGFSDLIILAPSAGNIALSAYTKRVIQTMSRLSSLIKTLQVRPSPPEALVQAYLIHIADKSDINFRKILDLKGIRRHDQGHLVELFMAHKSSPHHAALPQYSSFLTSLAVNSTTSTSAISTASGANLQTLQGRFDPASVGTAIMTAARDGVDRLGTPTLGVNTAAGSRDSSPPPAGVSSQVGGGALSAGTNVNQNLRNIGRFFKRDVGNFGGRFTGGG